MLTSKHITGDDINFCDWPENVLGTKISQVQM